MAVDFELLGAEAPARPAVERRRRSQHLRRQLALADILAGAASGAVGGAPPLSLPRLGGLEALPELVMLQQVDRVMIAFSRAHHEELLEVIRVCRDAGVAVDV